MNSSHLSVTELVNGDLVVFICLAKAIWVEYKSRYSSGLAFGESNYWRSEHEFALNVFCKPAPGVKRTHALLVKGQRSFLLPFSRTTTALLEPSEL